MRYSEAWKGAYDTEKEKKSFGGHFNCAYFHNKDFFSWRPVCWPLYFRAKCKRNHLSIGPSFCIIIFVELTEFSHSRFPLIHPSFVKLTQLSQFDKISHAWCYMELVIVWGTIWDSSRLILKIPSERDGNSTRHKTQMRYSEPRKGAVTDAGEGVSLLYIYSS